MHDFLKAIETVLEDVFGFVDNGLGAELFEQMIIKISFSGFINTISLFLLNFFRKIIGNPSSTLM